jgi:ketosteroid isomerase-like protein
MENPMETVDWALNFEEVRIFGDYALQWGTYGGSVRPRAGGERSRTGGKLMRILQRQPDGSWKMYRTMYTVDPPTP